MNKVKNLNPFSLGELNRLFDARFHDDVEYLKEWSERAVTYHEMRMGELYKIIDSQSLTSKMKTEEKE